MTRSPTGDRPPLRDGGHGQAVRRVAFDRSAAEVAESVLSEWLHWFGEEMDAEDARALERAVDAFRAAGSGGRFVRRA